MCFYRYIARSRAGPSWRQWMPSMAARNLSCRLAASTRSTLVTISCALDHSSTCASFGSISINELRRSYGSDLWLLCLVLMISFQGVEKTEFIVFRKGKGCGSYNDRNAFHVCRGHVVAMLRLLVLREGRNLHKKNVCPASYYW